jgi:hypothetical protein
VVIVRDIHTRGYATDVKHLLNIKLIEKNQHYVVIVGDSRTRGCATDVKHLLNSKFEVLGLVNSGLGLEFTK